MIMRKKILVTIILCCISTLLYSQYLVMGTILSEEYEPIENVNIRLFNADSVLISTTTTNLQGLFTIKNIDEGIYLLTVSHIGYENKEEIIQLINRDIKLDSLIIIRKAQELAEIDVVADQFIKRKDGILIFPRKEDLKKAGSGYDVLYNIMIPGINVDRAEGKVTRLGADVTLYIDGQKAAYREIQNLRSSEIEKIEYIDIPTGKYTQDDVVINIIMKQQKIGGYIAVDGTQNLGYMRGDYNFAAQYNTQNMNYAFFGGYNIWEYNTSGSSINENFRFTDYTLNRVSNTLKDRNKGNRQYGQFNIKSVSKTRKISVQASIFRNDSPINKSFNQTYSSPSNLETEVNSKSEEKNIRPTLNLYGGFKLTKGQSIDAYINGSYSNNQYYRNYNDGKFNFITDTDEDFYHLNTSINYTKQIQDKNTLSAYLLDNYRLSKTEYAGSLNYLQRLRTNETLFFIGYNHLFTPKWMLNTRLGMSWLSYKLKGYRAENKYFPRINATLQYRIRQKQNLSLQVNIGNSFPMSNSLNSIDQIVDPILMKRGNPDLDITKLYNISMTYNYFSQKINLQAMLINNIYVDMMISDYFQEGDKMIHSFRSNQDIYQQIGVFSAKWNILKKLSMKTELAFIHTKFSRHVNDHHNAVVASIDLNYSLRQFMINFYCKAKEKKLTNSYILEDNFARYGGDIRWSNDNWHIEVGVSNPFSTHNKKRNSLKLPSYNYNHEIYDKSFQQAAYIKLIYRFSFGKKIKSDGIKINTNIDSAIMKLE